MENFVPGKLEEFGLGYADLKGVAPGLIYCSVTGFGSEGPYREVKYDPHRGIISERLLGLNFNLACGLM